MDGRILISTGGNEVGQKEFLLLSHEDILCPNLGGTQISVLVSGSHFHVPCVTSPVPTGLLGL